MSARCIWLVTLLLFASACQTPSQNTEATQTLIQVASSTASATPSPTPTPTSTATPSATPPPATEVEISYPPSGELIKRVEVGEAGIFALTIDDGYGKVPFDLMLDELRARDLQATFFLVGRAALNLGSERLVQLAEDGHTIAYHSYAHDELTLLQGWSEADWNADFEHWREAMRSLLGEALFEQANRPYARAPYGLFSTAFLAMTEAQNLVPVGWSSDPGDLNREIALKPGDIFLLHVRFPDAELLPEILDGLDLAPVRLDELFAAQIGAD